MWACVVRVEIRIPAVQSLKQKRAVIRPHLERMRRLASVSISEVGGHDKWQRSTLGLAIVAPDHSHLDGLIEKMKRYLDSQLDIEVVNMSISYLEEP